MFDRYKATHGGRSIGSTVRGGSKHDIYYLFCFLLTTFDAGESKQEQVNPQVKPKPASRSDSNGREFEGEDGFDIPIAGLVLTEIFILLLC